MARPIFQIRQYLKTKTQDEWSEPYQIGSLFDNIFLDENSSFRLTDFYDHFRNFLKDAHFIRMGGDEPPKSENVKVWFDTKDNN